MIPVWIGFENAEKFLMPLYFEGTMLYSTLLFFFIFSAVSYLILEKLERSRILSIIMIIFYTISVIAGVMNGIGEEESIHIATYLWGLFLEIASILYLEGAAEMVKEKTGLENLIEETESGRAKRVLVPLQLVGALTIAIMLMSMIGGVGMAIDRSPPNISIISWELNETDTGTAEASLTFSINITELGNITEATEQGEISSRIMDFGIIVVEANESGTPK